MHEREIRLNESKRKLWILETYEMLELLKRSIKLEVELQNDVSIQNFVFKPRPYSFVFRPTTVHCSTGSGCYGPMIAGIRQYNYF